MDDLWLKNLELRHCVSVPFWLLFGQSTPSFKVIKWLKLNMIHHASCISLSKRLRSNFYQAAFLNSLSSHADTTAAMLATNKAHIPDISTLVVFQYSTKNVLQYISTNFDSLPVLKSTPSNDMFDRGFHAKHSTWRVTLSFILAFSSS